MEVPWTAGMKAIHRFRLPARATAPPVPDRVRRAIAAEQQQSEILISWVQMGVVLTFATLYALAPKTFSADAPFAPVPWALAAYFSFTVLRLALAYRMALPGWFLTMSVVIDMGLLLVLIWSFHLQYQQAPAFYLKAPTLVNIFIFIALRTLRFEAGYVVLAGGAAAFGWLLLVVYAAAFDPGGMPTTRDYVKYMTSPMILWGAEFEKISSILVVTAVLALALRRARLVLVRAVAEGTAASDLKRFFAPEVASRITRAEERIRPGHGEIRTAATLFVDLRGFTSLARTLPPDELMGVLSDYQGRMVPAIARHGGRIDKYLGDGILASFGAVEPSATFAADAARAVDDLVAAAAAWRAERAAAGKPTPAIGAAFAVGEVVFGAVGDDRRLEYTIIGDAVNLAAKLEKHNKVERVQALTTADAYRLACAQGYVPPAPKASRPQARVGGVDAPTDLVVLA